MIIPSAFVALVAAGWSMVVSSLYDAHGWSLRVQSLTSGPYLVGETHKTIRMRITLSNKTDTALQYPPFELAIRAAELRINLLAPDGRVADRNETSDPYGPSRLESWAKMEAGKSVVGELPLSIFGYERFYEMGKYKAMLTFKTPQGKVSSFPWVLEVVEPADTDILASQLVPVEGDRLNWPKEKQERVTIQQIKIGNRTWLFHRQFLNSEQGGKVSRTFRIAELPGKCEMKVEGAFGGGNPLTITYKDEPYRKWWTKHVISSYGWPWTADEERSRQERLKRAGQPAPPMDK